MRRSVHLEPRSALAVVVPRIHQLEPVPVRVLEVMARPAERGRHARGHESGERALEILGVEHDVGGIVLAPGGDGADRV